MFSLIMELYEMTNKIKIFGVVMHSIGMIFQYLKSYIIDIRSVRGKIL
jgi:hypothetical protein